MLASMEPVETDAIMASLQVTAGNAEIISAQLAEIIFNINSGKGTLGRLIQDTTIAENLSETMYNLKTSSKGLDENMEAAKHNFLLRGYFNKKEKAALDSIARAAKSCRQTKESRREKVETGPEGGGKIRKRGEKARRRKEIIKNEVE